MSIELRFLRLDVLELRRLKSKLLLRKGEKFKVIAFRDPYTSLAQRLVGMGLVCGAVFEVVGSAPLGDPVEIKFRGYNLSLRLTELEELTFTPYCHQER
ncbi:MAG: ferrous iron transport protein A [Deltaproteobacteria bacterium]|nr:ferrous iron transport protein A [Deltaproteobacteria bacterium]